MVCQVEQLAEAGERLGLHEQLICSLRHRLIRHVGAVWRHSSNVFARGTNLVPGAATDHLESLSPGVPREPDHFAPGDRVRVRSREQIAATLDARSRCDNLSYMPEVMDRYCGQSFRVRRRVDRFFDERRWRMCKLRGVVILDGAFCEPSRLLASDWAGCARSCFVFWKEQWLERLPEDVV